MLKLYFFLLLICVSVANCYAQQLSIQSGTINNLNFFNLVEDQTAGTALAEAPLLAAPFKGFYTAELNIILSWQEIKEIEFYYLQIAVDSSFQNNLINDSTISAAEYHFADLEYETTYYWRVRTDNFISTDPWSEVFHFSTFDLGPELLAPLNSGDINTIQPILRWQEKNGASKYWIQAAYDNSFKNLAVDDSSLTESSFQTGSLLYNQQYFWRVKSKRNGYFSLWSETYSFITFDGLNGWTNQFSVIKTTLNDIYFQDEQKGWIAGCNGKILKTGNGGAQWELTSSVTSVNLEAISFINDSLGWIAGWSGKILKTTDSGGSWEVQSSGTSLILRDIFFCDANNGWAVGERGIILKTKDGGQTWNAVSNITNNEYYSVHFSSPDTGCITGTSWNGAEYNSLVLYTHNGGQLWTAQNFTSIDFLTSMSFISANEGWAAGSSGSIIYTSDCGVHWTILNNEQNFDLYSLHFTDELIGWAAGTNGTCIYTSDGGHSWEIQPTNTRNFIRSVYFRNPDTGWMTGGSGSILHTASRGIRMIPQIKSPADKAAAVPASPVLSWKQAPLINTCQLQIAKDAQFSDMVLQQNITGDSSFTAGPLSENTMYHWRVRSYHGQMYSEWSNVNSFETEGIWKVQKSGAASNLNDVFFIDTQYGFSAGDSGTVIRTSNSGENWQTLNTPAKTNLQSIFFLDSFSGLSVGDSGTIIRTIDAGASWEQIPVNTNLSLKSVCFIGDTGWAVGGGTNDSSGQPNSVILRTLDRGKNWTVQQFNSPGYLRDIFFIDNHNGWAAGNGSYSKIIKTEDGGETWTAVEIDCDSPLNKIYFTDLQNGIAAGRNGNLFITNNGGQSWVPLQFPSSSDIKDYYFLTAKKSLVLANGIFTASENCTKWNTNYLDGNADFNAVTFASDKMGWIAGDDGLILKTSTGGQLEDNCCPKEIIPPQEFQLLQNYPNPFNPKTVISYQAGAGGNFPVQVELSVFNLLGQKVKTLVNKKQQPGSYSVSFDGSGLASGVYIYRLKAGSGFIKCRKLILLK